jgi:hypothetical protein
MTKETRVKQVNSPEHIAEPLTMINEATAPMTGGDYFRNLVAHLASAVKVCKALITECPDYPENHVRTLAFWEGDEFSEDISLPRMPG